MPTNETMHEIYWACAFALAVISVCVIAGNWWVAVTRRGSVLPLIGGALGILVLLFAPSPAVRRWWWLPAVIDVGSVPLAVWTGFWIFWRRIGRDSRN